MNKQNRNRPIDTENKLMVSKGERVEGIDKKKKKMALLFQENKWYK